MIDGMGIISYVRYYQYTNRTQPRFLEYAEMMARYIINYTLTADHGKWPSYPRSSGWAKEFPIDCASQGDIILGCDCIEPDKGAIMGYALLLLYSETQSTIYLDTAVHVAQVLSDNANKGADATQSPWPFRTTVDGLLTAGDRASNTIFAQRLLDMLVDQYQLPQFVTVRDWLWNWILTYQIPSPPETNSSLWVNFFEDMTSTDDRVSWSPLEVSPSLSLIIVISLSYYLQNRRSTI